MNLGFLAQITLGVDLMDLAAVEHHEHSRGGKLRGGYVNFMRVGTAGRVHLVTTCTLLNSRKEVLKLFTHIFPLLYSLITMVVK